MELMNPDSDFQEETLWERVSALDEMIPESVKSGVSSTWSGIKTIVSATKSTAWFVSSTAAVLLLPLSLELERQEYLEQSKRQERDILFGAT